MPISYLFCKVKGQEFILDYNCILEEQSPQQFHTLAHHRVTQNWIWPGTQERDDKERREGAYLKNYDLVVLRTLYY